MSNNVALARWRITGIETFGDSTGSEGGVVVRGTLGRQRRRRIDHHLLRRGLTQAQHEVRPHRVEVRRPAGQVQLAEHARFDRVRDVDDVERVDLAEGHQQREVVEPAHRLQLLSLSEPVEVADVEEPSRLRAGTSPATSRSVVSALTATRSTPSCSSMDQLPATLPSTVPMPAYRAEVPDRSNA